MNNNKLVLKVKVESDIYRYSFTERPSFEELCNVILPKSKCNTFTIKYIDDEQDQISLTNERELEEAWIFGCNLNPAILRITLIPKLRGRVISARNLEKRGFRLNTDHPTFLHNAICDLCKDRIAGIRYKCMECPDYDLCQQCISKRESEHAAGHHNFKLIGGWKRCQRKWTIICDGCNSTIEKDGFKCTNCPDYDLCSECYTKKNELHDSNHEFRDRNTIPFGRKRWINNWRMRNIAEKKEDPEEEVKKEEKIEVEDVESETEAVAEVKAEPLVVSQEEAKPEIKEQEQVKSDESEQEPEPLREVLNMLQDMGFGNREVNKFLLVSNAYNVPKTIHQLLAQ